MENFQAKMSPTATELSYSGTPEGGGGDSGALLFFETDICT